MQHITKKLIAAFSAAVLSAASVPASVCSASGEKTNLLILGDSISAGYGLAAGEAGYYDYVADCVDGTMTNLAKTGYATADLISQLDDAACAQAVAAADIICISVGGNDLMQPAKAYFEEYAKEGESMMDTLRRTVKEQGAETIVTGLTRALRTPRSTAKGNYAVIGQKILALNPDAEIIFQTVYNPFEVPESFLTERKYSANDIKNYNDLLTYVTNNEEQLNNAMRDLAKNDPDHYKTADVMAAFKSTGWLYNRILQKDVHPTLLGHALIAATVLDQVSTAKALSSRLGSLLQGMKISEYQAIPADDLAAMKSCGEFVKPLRGDADLSGKVTNADAQAVVTAYASIVAGGKMEDLVSSVFLEGADVTGDNTIGAEDPQYILMYYVANYVSNQPTDWDEIISPES